MFVNKWLTFTAAACLELVAGIVYAFSIFSPTLKESLNISQTQLQGLATALAAGGIFAFIPGMLYDAYIDAFPKWAPRLVGGVGVMAHVLAYLLLWLAATHRIYFEYWQLVLISLVAANCIVWLDTSLLATNIRNFPFEKGTIAGLLKGFLGLSASILATIYVGVFKPDQKAFLLFLTLFPAVLGIIALPFLNMVPFEEQSQSPAIHQGFSADKRFSVAYIVLIVLVVWQLGVSLLHEAVVIGEGLELAFMCVTLLILAGILLVPLRAGGIISHPIDGKAHPESSSLHDRNGHDQQALDEDRQPFLQSNRTSSSEHAALEQEASSGSSAGNNAKSQGQSKRRQPDSAGVESDADGAENALPSLTLADCIQSANYWLLWLSLVIGMGAGFTFLNNLSQLVQSRGGKEDSQDIFISLFTTNNCLGRIIAGYASERALHGYGCPRTLFLVGQLVLTAAVQACTAAAPLQALVPISIFGGLAFGGLWALMVALTSELFGMAHFASNYSLMHLAPNAGSFFMAATLAGSLYERARVSHPGESSVCIGYDCFRSMPHVQEDQRSWLAVKRSVGNGFLQKLGVLCRLTFILVSLLSLVAAGLSLTLYFRTRWVYARIFRQIQHHQQELEQSSSAEGQQDSRPS